MSTVAGFHVPVMPFEDVVGSAGTVPPAQTVRLLPKLNVGTILGFTLTVKVAVVAHWPASGVKVYTAGLLLSTTAGFQVPVIPLVDTFAKAGTVPPAQIVSEVPKLNVGVMFGLTVTLRVKGRAHIPAAGVKV